MGLMVEPSTAQCGLPAPMQPVLPVLAAKRLPDSQVATGSKDIAWAWLGTPTMRYPHKALGASTHAGSLHVLLNVAGSKQQEIVHELPFNRVFEDRMPRLVDLDGDGRDEIILIESDALRGSATVVYGVQSVKTAKGSDKKPILAELARSAQTGSTFRWLNPVGVADFDGDGKLDVASVITPHVGGLLTLYRYAPPKLEPFAQAMDTSNHRMGDLENSSTQQVAVIVSSNSNSNLSPNRSPITETTQPAPISQKTHPDSCCRCAVKVASNRPLSSDKGMLCAPIPSSCRTCSSKHCHALRWEAPLPLPSLVSGKSWQ